MCSGPRKEEDFSCVHSVLETTAFLQGVDAQLVKGHDAVVGFPRRKGTSSIGLTSSPSFPCGWRRGEGKSQRLAMSWGFILREMGSWWRILS